MAKQIFKQAPLPFVGQKRKFLTHVAQVLNDNIEGDGEGWTIVDVFGGSGLLAHTAKHLKPKARVIYNDFDGYSERLKHIPDINRLRQQIYAIVGTNTPRLKRLDADKKMQLIQAIRSFDGHVDVDCVASWLLFSGHQVKSLDALFSKAFWHHVRQTDYPSAEEYLEGLEITQESFHTLLPKFQQQEKVLLLLDPPYLCTHQDRYKQDNYFDLVDFLRVIYSTKPPYIFFSSTKSEFVRFIDAAVQEKWESGQAFDGAQRIVVQSAVSYSGQYEDNMVYKF